MYWLVFNRISLMMSVYLVAPPKFISAGRIKGEARQFRLACVLLLSTSLVAGCGKQDAAAGSPGGPAMPPLPVTVIQAKPQRVPVVIEAVGQTEGAKQVEVRARVSGILLRRHYTEGDTVRAGSLMFAIDPAPYEIALAQARAALAQEKANLEKAQREAARLKPLVEQRAISQKDYDDAASAQKTARASVMAAQAKVRDAELNLSYTKVTAPISGVSGRAQQSDGSLITAGTDAALLTTIDVTDPIWVRFSFSESEALQLRKAGGETSVKLVLPDGSSYGAAGKLNFSASTVDSRTGAVQLRAEFANPDLALLPGQFVRVRVATGDREAYLVPQSALSQTDQGKMLFTVSADNKVAPRPVETAGWSGHDWIVTQGLAAGDRVITDNLMKLRPGSSVAPHKPGQGPGEAGPGGKGAAAPAGKTPPQGGAPSDKSGSSGAAKQ